MSAPSESEQPRSERQGSSELEALAVLAPEAEMLHPVPLAGALPGQRRPPAALPSVQAAAAAAGGFVAGAALVGLVHRRQRRSGALARGSRARRLGRRPTPRGSRAGDLLEIVASRSLLLDVHLLGPSPGER